MTESWWNRRKNPCRKSGNNVRRKSGRYLGETPKEIHKRITAEINEEILVSLKKYREESLIKSKRIYLNICRKKSWKKSREQSIKEYRNEFWKKSFKKKQKESLKEYMNETREACLKETR